MSRRMQTQSLANQLAATVISALFAGISIALSLSALKVPRLETVVMSTLGGGMIAAFVYRERKLTANLDILRLEHQMDLVRWNSRIDVLYDDSLVSLAYFDAGTLMIDRVSPGLLEGLRIAPDIKTSGMPISELLHITPSKMERIVSETQRNRKADKQYKLLVEDAKGNQLNLTLTANYLDDVHMIEAAFYISYDHGSNQWKEMESARKDLDRFRRGMYRRETRILELKQEVNQVLKGSGEPVRYSTDLSMDNSKFQLSSERELRKSGERA